MRGKGTGIDRGRAQTLEQMAHGAQMIFVGMGDKHRLDLRLARLQPCNIGQDQIHTRCAVHIGKRHPQIHHDQAFLILGAIAVDVTIHPDFTGTAEGKIDQARAAHCCACSLLYL